ncbi:hypothetical protein KUTeg_005367 [Tegillarca granosa]|uniref:Coiled-coil domain-containing protein 186 n=1 Tax=Tegillarca granosa TaxID=220873 RepID=A0ABQ9FJI1_TEGGR|nr:hypothetical protein KUTeg_005367 [Tegillarca granosa]
MSDPENGDITENPEPEADTEGEVETDNPEGQYGVSSVNNEETGDHVIETEQGSGDSGACAESSVNVFAETNNDKLELNNYVAEGDCFGADTQNLNCDCTEADSELGVEIITEANTSSNRESQIELTEDDIEADLAPRGTNQDLMDRANCVPESEKDLQNVVVVGSSTPHKVHVKTGEQDQNQTSDSVSEDFTNNSVHDNQSINSKAQEDIDACRLTDSPLCTSSVRASDVDLSGLPEDEVIGGIGYLSENIGVKNLLEEKALKDQPEGAGDGDLPEDESIFLNSSNNKIVNGSANNARNGDTVSSVTVSETVSMPTGDQETSVLGVDDVKVPEDEIGSVGVVLSNRTLSVLSPAESVESYEPECDQETESAIEKCHQILHLIQRLKWNLFQEFPVECNSVILEESNLNSEKQVRSNSCVPNSGASTESNFVTTTSVDCSVNCDGNMPNKLSGSNNHQGHGCDGLDDKVQVFKKLESELGPSSEEVTLKFSNGNVNCSQFDNLGTINGVAVDAKIVQQCKELQEQLKIMKEQLQQQVADNERLKSDQEDTTCLLQKTIKERDSYLQEINIIKTRNQEDFYLPQIKELEYTIAQQQNEIRALKDKLSSHDTAAKRAISTLQGELKIRIDQVTKMYDDANKEKDAMVVKYAQAEKKSLESQKMIERLESKVRDGNKEKETYTERLKDMKMERKKLQADLDAKAAEVHSLSKDLEKQREMLSSSDETKTSLEKTLQKLKEAKEETEQIRRDCQAMIKTYQESEEMKSINLDQELKVFTKTVQEAQNTIKSLDAEITELKISNKDLVIDMEACRKRESEKLELTEKLSAKNAELQSENTNLSNKVLTYSGDLQNLRMKLQELETKQEDAIQTLAEEKRNLQQEIETLSSKLEEKSKAELQQTRRKLESYESNGDKDRNSMGSRTSSNGSLNTVGISDGTNSHAPPSVSIHNHNHVNLRQTTPPEQEYPVITEQVEPDKQLLIERIVKLQRALARKNEKIEFVNDHISQLVDEVQKKNKIIQNYALREEAGTLTPEVMDINKEEQALAQLSRKHSIMSSVYSSHSTDGSMTLDLSLEINKKLQAVLEDTLLKNITLKFT